MKVPPLCLSLVLVFHNQQAIKIDTAWRSCCTSLAQAPWGWAQPSATFCPLSPAFPPDPSPWADSVPLSMLLPRLPTLAPSSPCSVPRHSYWERLVLTHRARARLSEEGLEVSSCHELQQDKSRQGLQTHPDTAHDVLVVELAAEQRGVTEFN